MKTLLFATAAAVLIATPCYAIPSLTVTDGTTSTTVSDASGIVTFSGAIGSWNINVDTGIASPPAGLGGSPSNPAMDLTGQNTFNGTVGVGNVLTVTFTDDNLGPINTILNHFVTGSVPIGTMTAVFNLLINGVVVDSINGFNGSGAFNATDVPAGSTVSVQAILTATSASAFTSFDTGETSVPDGGLTLAMLGCGLTGLAFFARRKTA